MNVYIFYETCKYNDMLDKFVDNDNNPITGIMYVKSGMYRDIMNVITDGERSNLAGPALITKTGKLEYFYKNISIGENLSNKEFKQKIKELIFS